MTTDTKLQTGTSTTETGGQTDAEKATADAAAKATTDAAAALAATQQTADQKKTEAEKPKDPAAEKPKEGTETKDDAVQGAPEKYEFKAPEGQKFDDALTAQYSEIARELNLPQDAAQKVIDKMAPAIAARQLEAVKQQAENWQKQSEADKQFGGEKFAENLGTAKKALDAFASPELKKMLGDFDVKDNPQGTGLQRHPEVIRMFLKLGQAISEDNKIVTGHGLTPEQSAAAKLYPNQATNK